MKKERRRPVRANQINRRTFLSRAVGTATLLVIPEVIPSSVLGADGATSPGNRITVGLIGKGAMGSGHLHRLAYDSAFQLVGVCDVDTTRREAGRKLVDEIHAATRQAGSYKSCVGYKDYRELLARSDVDAVVIVTPDHWHTLQSIDAAKAGKDIYCEKPISVTVEEGRRLVETVRRYGRVFQTGTQYRSIPSIRKVCQFIREGRLGRVKQVFTLYQPLAGFIGAARFKPYEQVMDMQQCGKLYAPTDFALPAEPVPEGLDWDLWVGPAPWRPYNSLYHTNPSPGVVPWSFCDAFGVTSSTWFLSHAADVIQWALGFEHSGPVEVIHASSGQFPTLTCKYSGGTLLHFVDHWGQVKDLYRAVPKNARLAGNFGGVFVGQRGWITSMSAGGSIEGEPESLFDEIGVKHGPEVNIGSNDHHANWLHCMRVRKAPSADEEIGHRTASLGHLANIASLTGQSLKWDPAHEKFADNEGANRLLSRAMRSPWRS